MSSTNTVNRLRRENAALKLEVDALRAEVKRLQPPPLATLVRVPHSADCTCFSCLHRQRTANPAGRTA